MAQFHHAWIYQLTLCLLVGANFESWLGRPLLEESGARRGGARTVLCGWLAFRMADFTKAVKLLHASLVEKVRIDCGDGRWARLQCRSSRPGTDRGSGRQRSIYLWDGPDRVRGSLRRDGFQRDALRSL